MLVRYSVILNGISELAVMKLDVLDELKTLKICTAYRYEGKIYKDFPMDFAVLNGAEPVYEDMEGWRTPLCGIRKFQHLPLSARRYVNRMEELVGARIKYISIGSKRDEIIVR